MVVIIENMLKLIIFDWDDVIVLGSKEGYFACYHKALLSVGISLAPQEEHRRIVANWGKSYKQELRGLLPESLELLPQAVKAFDREYWGDTFVSSLKMLPGTNETLLTLSKKYLLAVATGNQLRMIKTRISPHFNIPDVFSRILTSNEIKDQSMTKPHPFMLEKIMDELGVKPEETIYVGDSSVDVEMASNARVIPVIVLSGHLNKKEAERLKVKHIIHDITCLGDELPLLQEL